MYWSGADHIQWEAADMRLCHFMTAFKCHTAPGRWLTFGTLFQHVLWMYFSMKTLPWKFDRCVKWLKEVKDKNVSLLIIPDGCKPSIMSPRPFMCRSETRLYQVQDIKCNFASLRLPWTCIYVKFQWKKKLIFPEKISLSWLEFFWNTIMCILVICLQRGQEWHFLIRI